MLSEWQRWNGMCCSVPIWESISDELLKGDREEKAVEMTQAVARSSFNAKVPHKIHICKFILVFILCCTKTEMLNVAYWADGCI